MSPLYFMSSTSSAEDTTSKTSSSGSVLDDRSFTDGVLLVCCFDFLGSIVFSRGSKKVLFWRTVQEQ